MAQAPTKNSFVNVPVPYDDANQRLQKSPVYYCRFGKVVGPLGEGSADIPDEYATGPVKNPSKARKLYMGIPSQASNQINVIEGKSSIGSFEFVLHDQNNEITRLIASHTMKNRIVYVYAGYQEIDEQYFIPRGVGQIDDLRMTHDGTAYTFAVVSALKQAMAPILQGQTKIKVGITAEDTDIQLMSTENFAPSTDMGDGLGARNYLRIQDEIISYKKMSNGIASGCKRGIVLGGNGGPAVDHSEGEDVKNYILLHGNPLTLLLQVLLSTGSNSIQDGSAVWKWIGTGAGDPWESSTQYEVGDEVRNNGNLYECIIAGKSGLIYGPDRAANWSGTGVNYDVFPVSQGVGVPHELVNIANIEAQRDKYIAWMSFSNYFEEKVAAQNFLEEEICKIINAYPIENKAGQYDLKLWVVPLPTNGAPVLDDTNIIGIPGYQGNFRSGVGFFNHVQVNYDYQPISDYYSSINITNQGDSQGKYKEVSPVAYNSKMVRSYLQGSKVVNRLIGNVLARFKDPPPIFTVQCFYSLDLLQAGNNCFLNSSIVPNTFTGTRGGSSQICEVIDQSTDFESGTVSLTLLGTGLSSTRKYAAISPANYPVFTAATEVQKRYAFISTLVSAYTKGTMSDGSDGYYITP